MVQVPSNPVKQKTAPRSLRGQRALVIGVSGYPVPISKLPAVAADVRAIAKMLSSKAGIFSSAGVTVLTERQARRDAILGALKDAFVGARASDTVFVYLAGHGAVDGDAYYFVPYDAKVDRLAETGVPLAEIKRLFDRTASRRVFLWLDFCHSGGILARGAKTDDVSAIRRAIGVVSGQGKVIVAACTPSQSAYEDTSLGHGLFTHALLRGLAGEAKSAQGEVTALSLYEFIDHQVKHRKQQPTFYGEMEGRIVLMNYVDRTVATAPSPTLKPAAPKPETKSPTVKKTPAVSQVSASGNLLLLDGRVYTARSVSERHDGSVEAQIVPKNPEEEAALRSLRGDRFSQRLSVSFAFRNQSFTAQVEEVSSVTTASTPAWSVALKPAEARSHYISGMGYHNLSVEEIADMRASLLLLGEQRERSAAGTDSMLLSFVKGPLKDLLGDEGLFPPLWKRLRSRPEEFLRQGRLWAVYYLKAGDVCDDVLELRLGPVRAGKLAVRFRGRRKSQYSNGKPHEFLVEGTCTLT